MRKITRNSESISIENHIGTWYVINSGIAGLETVYLLEHEEWGDEVNSIIVNEDGKVLSAESMSISEYDKELKFNEVFGMSVEEMFEDTITH